MNKFFIVFLIIYSQSIFCEEANPYLEYRADTYKMQKNYLSKISEHQNKVMDDLEVKLEQQRWQTNAIAIIVYLMVGIGLLLSYLQFRRDKDNKTESAASLKIGPGEMEIKSPVIGLVILALSFWFFQTYIDHVYNVNVFNVPMIDMTTFGQNK